jgi:hypothetical protein
MLKSVSQKPYNLSGINQSGLVVTEEKLSLKSLENLINGDILAIRVPNYIKAENCEELVEKIINSSQFGFYATVPLLG